MKFTYILATAALATAFGASAQPAPATDVGLDGNRDQAAYDRSRMRTGR